MPTKIHYAEFICTVCEEPVKEKMPIRIKSSLGRREFRKLMNQKGICEDCIKD